MAEQYMHALPSFPAKDDTWFFFRDAEKNGTLIVADSEHIGLSSTRDYYFVNPLEVPIGRYAREKLWAFQFGAYGWTRLLVYAPHLEDALEEAAGWLGEFAPGHLSDLKEEYEDALKEAREELGEDADEEELEEKAREIAETDMTYTESGYLTSHEWTVDEASGDLLAAAEYAAKAVYAAENNMYYMYMKLPLGKGETDALELDTADVEKMLADEELGLTASDVQKMVALKEDESVDLKAFRIERIG